MIKRLLKYLYRKLHQKRRKLQDIKPSTRRKVYFRDGGRCRYCNRKLNYNSDFFHLDHVRAVWHFGIVFNNLVTSCETCNLRKSRSKGWEQRLIPLPIHKKVYNVYLWISEFEFRYFI